MSACSPPLLKTPAVTFWGKLDASLWPRRLSVNRPPAPSLPASHTRAPFCSPDLPSSFSPVGSALAAPSAQSIPPTDVHVAPSFLVPQISAQVSLSQQDLPGLYKLEESCSLPTPVSITSALFIFFRPIPTIKSDFVHLFLICLLPPTCKFSSILFTLYP